MPGKIKKKAERKVRHPNNVRNCAAGLDQWRVLDRHCNYSKFNGGHHTPSDYSSCKCLECGFTWRTKADYVALLHDATAAERFKV